MLQAQGVESQSLYSQVGDDVNGLIRHDMPCATVQQSHTLTLMSLQKSCGNACFFVPVFLYRTSLSISTVAK